MGGGRSGVCRFLRVTTRSSEEGTRRIRGWNEAVLHVKIDGGPAPKPGYGDWLKAIALPPQGESKLQNLRAPRCRQFSAVPATGRRWLHSKGVGVEIDWIRLVTGSK